MNKINSIVMVSCLYVFGSVVSSCASDRTSSSDPRAVMSSSAQAPIIYYINGKTATQTEYESFVENLNSEKIDYSHEETRNGISTFYRLKDARGHLYQVTHIQENQRRTMSVNVLSK